MQIKYIPPFFFLLFFSFIGRVGAQVQSINKEASPLNISLSAMYVDDVNPTIFGETAAYGVGLSTYGQLIKSGEGVQVLADYAANFEGYKLTEDNNFLDGKQDFHDYKVRLFSRFFIAQSWHFDAEVMRTGEVQKYGEGISQLRTDVFEADQFQQNSGALTLVYGHDSSSRFVSLKLFTNDDMYEKNNDYSSLFNVTQQGAELNVAFRQSKIFSFWFKFSAVADDYESVSRDDSDVYRALLGVNWQSTGKSNLEAWVGAYWREYSDKSSNSGLSWIVDYSISPSDNWRLKFNSARFSDVSKSEFTSDSIKQNIGFDIRYDYSEQWKVGGRSKVERTKFNEFEVTTKLDEVQVSLYISLEYKPYSKVSLTWGKTSKSTSDQTIDYQQSQMGLAWQLEF